MMQPKLRFSNDASPHFITIENEGGLRAVARERQELEQKVQADLKSVRITPMAQLLATPTEEASPVKEENPDAHN